MIFKSVTLALSLLVGSSAASPFSVKPVRSNSDAKSKYMSSLMTKARRLDGDDAAAAEVDLTPYYLQFQKCQYVKQAADEYDEDTGYFEVKKYVIFRLCESCNMCSYNYGEYLVGMEDYLDATVEYFQNDQDDYCDACDALGCDADDAAAGDDAGNADEDGDEEEEEEEEGDEEEEEEDGDEEDEDGGRRLQYNDLTCDDCYQTCQKIANMEENYRVDATNYLECQQLEDQNADDGASAVYAGAACNSSGDKIKIGMFSDEYCTQSLSGVDIEDYLVDEDGNQVSLSHGLLKKVYSNSCISCLVPNYDENDGDEEAEAEVQEVCQNVYEAAAKCESNNGFAGYLENDQYANQEAQESTVCDYISQIANGVYDYTGEIYIGSGDSSTIFSGSTASAGQKFALAALVIGSVGLAIFAATLHSKITKGSNLSQQGGAMA